MRTAPRRISLEGACRNGQTWLRIYCQTERATPRQFSHGVNVCGHLAEMPVADAIARWGAQTSLSDLPLVCSVCGGRNFSATTVFPPLHDPRR